MAMDILYKMRDAYQNLGRLPRKLVGAAALTAAVGLAGLVGCQDQQAAKPPQTQNGAYDFIRAVEGWKQLDSPEFSERALDTFVEGVEERIEKEKEAQTPF